MARPVAQFALIGLAGLFTVGVATLVASQRIGQREAISDVRTTTLVRAQGLVEPVVTDALASGDPAAVAAVAGVVEHGVIDASLVRVKIWTASGTIVYSDEDRLQGSTYPLEEDELDALRTGSITAGVSNLAKPENRYERDLHKLLEVYLPIRTPTGQRLLFEAYYRFDVVSASANRIWRSFAPVALGSLIVLELLQIPLAYGLARRLQQRQQEREALLHRALAASDIERRRIAGDLHDGVVQDLTGVTYTLAAAARARSTPPPTAALLDEASASVRSSLTGLRTLMVDLYPPDLEDRGFEAAMGDLLGPVTDAGIEASCDDSGLSRPLPTPVAELVLPGHPRSAAQRGGALERVEGGHHRRCRRRTGLAAGPRRRGRLRGGHRGGEGGGGPHRAADPGWPGSGSRRPSRRPPGCPGWDRARAGGAAVVIRVLIVDDHAVVRHGLEQLLDSAEDIEVAGSAADGAEAVERAGELAPDVILMDLSMPGVDGVEATRRLSALTPGCRVVVLTSFADQRRILAALDAGASGYILKDAAPDELLAAVRAAASGGAPLDPKAARVLLDRRRAPVADGGLSPRERQVLDLVADGLANKAIARRLGIAERTVKAHLTSIFQQLGVTDRTQAALWAREHPVAP